MLASFLVKQKRKQTCYVIGSMYKGKFNKLSAWLKRNGQRLLYLLGWCAVMLFAAFPRLVLEGDTSCLISTSDCQSGIVNFVVPMTMIIVGYLLDTTYTLATTSPGPNKMRLGFIYQILLLAFSLIGIVFAMYFTDPTVKVICFIGTFLLVSALKWVSLIIADKDVINLIKPEL